jgi:WhiB family transcriptional regulator, redox-sensing transcriptional regulator
MASIMQTDTWELRAACRGLDSDTFFQGSGGSYKRAREVCTTCTVSGICLDEALAIEQGLFPETHGMRGGLTPEERLVEWRKRRRS